MRQVNSFGQIGSQLPNNPAIGFPVNNPADAARLVEYTSKSIPTSRTEYGKRKMLKWLAPERGIIDMYINPQNIRIQEQKLIKSERSKGGFIIQYWGEDLTSITIDGHTGSSGIEGINVLRDIYRAEQGAFDVIALEELAKYQNEDEEFLRALLPGIGQIEDFIEGLADGTQGTGLAIPKPTLGFYASTVEMYWMGEVYRGFFENFSVTESTSKLGVFDYSISFKATQRRGIRRNYLPWHHNAVSGPSDHQSIPYTFSSNSVPMSNGSDLIDLQAQFAFA